MQELEVILTQCSGCAINNDVKLGVIQVKYQKIRYLLLKRVHLVYDSFCFFAFLSTFVFLSWLLSYFLRFTSYPFL